MKKMIKLAVVLVGVGGLCFGAAMGVSLLVIKPAPKTAAATEPAPASVVPDMSQGGEISLKQRELDELVREVRSKLAACAQREQRLEERERRIQMAQELLKKDAQELENLRLQLVAPLTQAREAQAELKKLRVTVGQQEKANLKKIAQIYEKMEPTEAARILEGMVTNKLEDDAVKLLHFMSDRAAARLLGALTEKSIGARLTEKMKRVQEES